jgi:hypothetical protein
VIHRVDSRRASIKCLWMFASFFGAKTAVADLCDGFPRDSPPTFDTWTIQ